MRCNSFERERDIYKALLGKVHFIGIGGIGMSALARLLRQGGYEVSGSDITRNSNCQILEEIGARICYEHKAENLEGASFVVFSSAISSNNPEVLEAKRRGITLVHRSLLLSMLMKRKLSIGVSGSHGKTTTTALIRHLLDTYDPSFICGGIDIALGSNAKLGSGEVFVSEADESDGTFLNLKPDIAIVTSIGKEHMSFYGSFEKCLDSFYSFVTGVPFYGCSIVSLDNSHNRELLERIQGHRIITFGLGDAANVRALNVKCETQGSAYDVETNIPWLKAFSRQRVSLPLLGMHNVHNSLAGFALLAFLKVEGSCLSGFRGVKRRCEVVGEYKGAKVIDDYAVHPTEVRAVLEALRAHCGSSRIIAVLQPHRYSRLSALFNEFISALKGADKVYVAEVFAAWEEPLEGISGLELAQAGGHTYVDSFASLESHLTDLRPGDLLVLFGAGSITSWGKKLASI